MTHKDTRRKHHLPGRNFRTVMLLNNLIIEAHNIGFLVKGVLDTKQLPFPIIDIRLFKEAQYEAKKRG